MEPTPNGEVARRALVSAAGSGVAMLPAAERPSTVGRRLWPLCLAWLCVIPSTGVLCSQSIRNEYAHIDGLAVAAPVYDEVARSWLETNKEFLADMMGLGDYKWLVSAPTKCGICEEAFEAGNPRSKFTIFVNGRQEFKHLLCTPCDACGISRREAVERRKRANAADARRGIGVTKKGSIFASWMWNIGGCEQCMPYYCCDCFVLGVTGRPEDQRCSECESKISQKLPDEVLEDYKDAKRFLKEVAKIDSVGVSELQIVKRLPSVTIRFKFQQPRLKGREGFWRCIHYRTTLLSRPFTAFFTVLSVVRGGNIGTGGDWRLHHTWLLLLTAFTEYQIRKLFKKRPFLGRSKSKQACDAEESRLIYNLVFLLGRNSPSNWTDQEAIEFNNSWYNLDGKHPWCIQRDSEIHKLLESFVGRVKRVLSTPPIEVPEAARRRRAVREARTAERQILMSRTSYGTTDTEVANSDEWYEPESPISTSHLDNAGATTPGTSDEPHVAPAVPTSDIPLTSSVTDTAAAAAADGSLQPSGGDCRVIECIPVEAGASTPASDFADPTTATGHLRVNTRPERTAHPGVVTTPCGFVPETDDYAPNTQDAVVPSQVPCGDLVRCGKSGRSKWLPRHRADGCQTSAASEPCHNELQTRGKQPAAQPGNGLNDGAAVGNTEVTSKHSRRSSVAYTSKSMDRSGRPGDDATVRERTKRPSRGKRRLSLSEDSGLVPMWNPMTSFPDDNKKSSSQKGTIGLGE